MWPWIVGVIGASAAWWNAQKMKRSVRGVPWAETAYKVLYEKDAEEEDFYDPRLEWPRMAAGDIALGYTYPYWNYKNAESNSGAHCVKCKEILDNDDIDKMWIITKLDGSNYILCDSCVDNAPGFYTSCKICGDMFEEHDFTTSRGSLNRSRRDPPFDISDVDETVCLNCAKERAFQSPQDAYIYAYNKGHIDARDRGTNYNPLEYDNKDFNKIIRHAEDEVVSRGKKGKVITLTGSDPRLRTINEDKDITPEEASQRTEISAEEENTTVLPPHQLGQLVDWQPFDESYFPTKKRAETSVGIKEWDEKCPVCKKELSEEWWDGLEWIVEEGGRAKFHRSIEVNCPHCNEWFYIEDEDFSYGDYMVQAESFSAEVDPRTGYPRWSLISCRGCSMNVFYCEKCDEWFCEKCDDDHETEYHAAFEADDKLGWCEFCRYNLLKRKWSKQNLKDEGYGVHGDFIANYAVILRGKKSPKPICKAHYDMYEGGAVDRLAESFGVDPYEIERWACSWCGDEHSKHSEADLCCEDEVECDICEKDFVDMSDIHECYFCIHGVAKEPDRMKGLEIRKSPWHNSDVKMWVSKPTRVCGDCCIEYPYLDYTYKICYPCATEVAATRSPEETSLKQRAKKALQEGGRMGSSYPVKMDAETFDWQNPDHKGLDSLWCFHCGEQAAPSEETVERDSEEGIDTCPACGNDLTDLESMSYQEYAAEEKCYHCGSSGGKMYYVGKKGMLCHVCSEGGVKYRAEDNFESAVVFDKPKGPVEKALQYQMGIHDLQIQEALLSLDSDVRFGLISEKDAFQRFLEIVG